MCHFHPQSRTPQSHAYHFRTRVGAYCIRPTDVFGRKRMPCICVIHFRMYAGFMRFCGIRARLRETFVRFCTYSPRSGSFVGRIQYAPTRGRKRYAQDVVIRARLRETVVRFCTYSSRSGSFVGRILLRPTRGYEMVMRNGGIRDRGHKIFMHIGLSLFFGR